jgi:hypothetical protein
MVKKGIQDGLHESRRCPYGQGDASKKILDILKKEFE